MTVSREHHTEAALIVLLDALASVLIELEVTPARLAQIARSSFVKASTSKALTQSSGRPHLARIAALTGLTRLEVKRIVASNFRVQDKEAESQPRAFRVLSGWQTSRVYTRRGKPRRLRIVGDAPSFHSLCKEYSGDIPHTVILRELERQNRIVVEKGSNLVSIARSRRNPKPLKKEQELLAFASRFLRDALRPDATLVIRKERVTASSAISNSYVEDAVSGRMTELLDQMPELFGNPKGSKRKIVNVYALVARAAERKKRSDK